ncbi:MAG: hypothetical protein K0S12_1412 [Bacteroidetes bacterium]|jgi:hypothetical protein|nr:hypothetical protein [Bacteroidota bacterium]
MKKVLLVLMFFSMFQGSFFAQDQTIYQDITDKAVIGFPSLTTNQLNLIKAEFLKHSQIQQATYVFGTYNCMLIKLDVQGETFKKFYDLLKPLSEFYDINQCYIKPYSIYEFAEQNIGSTPTFIIKP